MDRTYFMRFRQQQCRYFLIIVLLSVNSCGRDQVSGLTEKSKALLSHPSARDVKLSELYGTFQVEYWVDEAYPARKTIEWVSKHLKDNGWEELPGSYFNPQIKGVNPKDWVKIFDSRGPEETVVFQSVTDWKDAKNNILVYGFEYRYPRRSEPDLRSVKVRAILFPADIAKKELEAVQKDLKRALEKK